MVTEPIPPVLGESVALKIQRRKYGSDALDEIGIHYHLVRRRGPCAYLVRFHEGFFFDGHIFMAYGLHGRSMTQFTREAPLPLTEVRIIARHLYTALAHMHEEGLIHTDIKPGNLLYQQTPTPVAKLSDLGTADRDLRVGTGVGTRPYRPPELLLGHQAGPPMDIWAAAASIFELATGQDLFDPWAAAKRKYIEFSQDAPEPEFDPSVKADEEQEKGEQYEPGTLIAGKYRLVQKLGQGGFATVWLATVENDLALEGSFLALKSQVDSLKDAAGAPAASNPAVKAWKAARGADDLHDMVLKYEHLVEIQNLVGQPPPATWAKKGIFAPAYLDDLGRLKNDPVPPGKPQLIARLEANGIEASQAKLLADFLRLQLSWKAADRPTAQQCLAHRWLIEDRPSAPTELRLPKTQKTGRKKPLGGIGATVE